MNIQTQIKEKNWKDETGSAIPVKRVTKAEKLRENLLHKSATDAYKAHKMLAKLKDDMRQSVQSIIDAVVEENGGKTKETKAVTLYNFDGSIKLETTSSNRIDFDSVLLDQCKAKLDELLNKNISSDDDFIKEIVLDAFETSRGRPDHRKLLALKKFSKRIKDPLYHQAMELLDKSIRRPDSRTYYRVWIRDQNGKYQNIDLNFSSIEA